VMSAPVSGECRDRDAWREQRFFATLAEALPAHTWRRE